MSTIHITKAGRGEHWLVGGETTTVKVSGRDTDGELLVVKTSVPPGGGPSLVRHEFIETFYVLEGKFEFSTMEENDEPETVSAAVGDNIFVPCIAWHSYNNLSDAWGKLFNTFLLPQ